MYAPGKDARGESADVTYLAPLMERLGRYTLERILGEGGAGRVHLATLQGPGGFEKQVALKVLHQGDESLRR